MESQQKCWDFVILFVRSGVIFWPINISMKKVVVGILSRINKNNEQEYLLVSSTKDFGEYTGFYYPPGGHLENGETFEQALVREMREELGIEIRPDREIAVTPGDVPDQATHWWTCELIGGVIDPQKDEIAATGFFTLEQMRFMNIRPATKKFFEMFAHEL
jgi:8-oxo-dGTP pyrophosphatase MutT (NUDIX family)